jgi:gluconate kinase
MVGQQSKGRPMELRMDQRAEWMKELMMWELMKAQGMDHRIEHGIKDWMTELMMKQQLKEQPRELRMARRKEHWMKDLMMEQQLKQ